MNDEVERKGINVNINVTGRFWLGLAVVVLLVATMLVAQEVSSEFTYRETLADDMVAEVSSTESGTNIKYTYKVVELDLDPLEGYDGTEERIVYHYGEPDPDTGDIPVTNETVNVPLNTSRKRFRLKWKTRCVDECVNQAVTDKVYTTSETEYQQLISELSSLGLSPVSVTLINPTTDERIAIEDAGITTDTQAKDALKDRADVESATTLDGIKDVLRKVKKG